MQVIYIYFMLSECFDSYQVRSLGNGLDNTLYAFYLNDLKNGTYTRPVLTADTAEKNYQKMRHRVWEWIKTELPR